jgi:hypothetical protein
MSAMRSEYITELHGNEELSRLWLSEMTEPRKSPVVSRKRARATRSSVTSRWKRRTSDAGQPV